MAEDLAEPESLDPSTFVRSEMEQRGFRFEPQIDGVEIRPPDKSNIIIKYQDDPIAQYFIDVLYDYLAIPLIEYPEGVDTQVAAGTETPIDIKDEELRTFFAEKGDPYKDAFNKVIERNRYRVGTYSNVESVLNLAPDVISEEQTQGNIKRILGEINRQGVYKTKSKDEKRMTIRQYSKASELALRALNKEPIADSDIEELGSLNPSSN